MSTTRNVTPGRRGYARLTPDADRQLTDLLAKHGPGGVERRLGVSVYLLDKLAHGGAATPDAVARVEARLAKVRT